MFPASPAAAGSAYVLPREAVPGRRAGRPVTWARSPVTPFWMSADQCATGGTAPHRRCGAGSDGSLEAEGVLPAPVPGRRDRTRLPPDRPLPAERTSQSDGRSDQRSDVPGTGEATASARAVVTTGERSVQPRAVTSAQGLPRTRTDRLVGDRCVNGDRGRHVNLPDAPGCRTAVILRLGCGLTYETVTIT